MSLFTPEQDAYIDHEVRIRKNEETYKDLKEIHKETKEVLKELRQEIHNNFKWTVTMFMTILVAIIGLFGGLLLTRLL